MNLRMKETFEPTPTSANRWEGNLNYPPAYAAPAKRARAKAIPSRSIEQQLLIVLAIFILSLASYYCISKFFITSVQVQGRSMVPTLFDGERYLLNRLTYQYRPPQRGEVVVIQDPGHQDFAVKRIIAGPQECISFADGKVFVNGTELKEPYLKENTVTEVPSTKAHRIVLGKDQYFVLGDNRGLSEDSRYYGAVTRNQIIGALMK